MFVFGGQGETNSVLADMWSFDFATSQWQRLDEGDGGPDTGVRSKKPSPTARYGHVAVSDAHGESMLMLGGCNRHVAHTDYLWQFHFGTQQACKSHEPCHHQCLTNTCVW
jgi:N-acetylneuraminic acid mutarotase